MKLSVSHLLRLAACLCVACCCSVVEAKKEPFWPNSNDPSWPGQYPPQDEGGALMINIRPDAYPEQTSWYFESRTNSDQEWTSLEDSSQHEDMEANEDDKLDSNGTTTMVTPMVYSYLHANLTHKTHYRLRVKDTRGNGLCCEDGWISITTSKTTKGNNNAEAGSNATKPITTGNWTDYDIPFKDNTGVVLYTFRHFGYEAILEFAVDRRGSVTLIGLGGLEFSFSSFSPNHGPIPSQLVAVSTLEWLDLKSKHIEGNIPSQLGLLSNLQWMDLSDNQLRGSIPCQLANLTALEWLDLSGNNLEGSLCEGLSWASLSHLDLSENRLAGGLPSSIGRMTALTHLRIHDSDLTGTLCTEIGLLGQLQYLRLSYNGLNGPLPSEMGQLTSLVDLHLGDNDFSDTIPSAIGGMTSLTSLYVSQNQLTGPIPSDLGELVNLVELHLSDNQLSGLVPTELGHMRALTDLKLRFNDHGLSGTVPFSLCATTYLTFDCGDPLCGCEDRRYGGCPCVSTTVSRVNDRARHIRS